MNRTELLKTAKPILFSGEMVKALLSGTKTQTRRVAKCKYSNTELTMWNDRLVEMQIVPPPVKDEKTGLTTHSVAACVEVKPKYQIGDILYVREIFAPFGVPPYLYKANDDGTATKCGLKWKPSIHMPKEAARIFLRVTGVKVERVEDITEEDAKAEGAKNLFPPSQRHDQNSRWVRGLCTECEYFDMMTMMYKKNRCYMSGLEEPQKHYPSCGCVSNFKLKSDDTPEPARFRFLKLWNKVSPPGCGHNPWVFVYTFERVEVES